MPFDQTYAVIAKLVAGNTVRMNAAAAVVIGRKTVSKRRAVRMTGNEHTVGADGIGEISFFKL